MHGVRKSQTQLSNLKAKVERNKDIQEEAKDRNREKEKGVAEDEMFRQYHRLNGHEFEQTPGDVEDKGAWHAAVYRVNRVRHNLATEHQPSIAVPFLFLKENISNICQGEQDSP